MNKRLLLLSGGLDSVALAAWTRPSACLTINYGQKAANAEIQSSAIICNRLGLKHVTLVVPLDDLGTGTMSRDGNQGVHNSSEFWAFRNQFLVTIAAMYAFKFQYDEVNIGTVLSDKARHKDGTGEFIFMLNNLIQMQEGEIVVKAPAQKITSAELIIRSKIPSSTLAWAHSCHISNIACGRCNGCIKHSEILSELGWNR